MIGDAFIQARDHDHLLSRHVGFHARLLVAHEHFVCHAKNEKHYHVAVDKCEICNFEFSISMPGIESSDLQTETPLDSYTNRYNFLSSLDFSQYSFLLRAPPIRQI